MAKSKYSRRADGLLETTRTDKRTGKRIHFYGHSDREIDRQILEFTTAAERGRLFRTVADEWSGLHYPTLAPNTLKGYKPACRRAIEEFGDCPIRQIKPMDIKRYIAQFARQGYAKKTVTTQLLVLHLIFNYAIESEDVTANPCERIAVPKNLAQHRREAATPAEEKLVKESSSIWLLPCFLLYTGMRKGEALALQWKDIDLNNDTIRITKSVYHDNNKPCIKAPKTEAGKRTVPILKPLKTILEQYTIGNAEDYLFSATGDTPLSETAYQKLWADWIAATGCNITAHQLRHSFATMLFECGISVKDAQDLLGHSTAATTQDIYTHIRDSHKSETVARLNAALED